MMLWRCRLKAYIPVVGLLFLVLCSFASLEAEPVSKQQRSTSELISGLKNGGHIIYIRHASTDLESKDTDLSDCNKQRNLSEIGRSEAKDIGQSIKRLGIPIGDIYSSPYCRCKDTAQLIFDRYTIDQNLQFSIKKDRRVSEQLGQHLLTRMQMANVSQHNDVFVGHTSNLRDGLGVFPKPEGVAVIFQKQGNGLTFLGMIKPGQWPAALDMQE